MDPSTPPPRPSIPATSPYGSPDPLSDPPGPLSPESPLQTLPIHPSSQFTANTTPCKPRIREEDGAIVQQSSCTAAPPDSSMEEKFPVFLPSESSPPPEFQTSPMKQPGLATVREQESDGLVEGMDIQGPSFEEDNGLPAQEQDELDTAVSANIDETIENEYTDLPLPTIAESPPADSFHNSFALSSSPPRIPSPTSMTSTPIPSAKRRRLNSSITATNKLMRPFKSPFKSNNTLNDTPTQSPRKYPPSTPPQKTTIPYTPLPRPPKSEDTDTPESSTKPTPSIAPKSVKSTIKSNNPPFRSSFKKSKPILSTQTTKDPYILSLEQKLSQLQTSVKNAKQTLEESSQALKIEQSGEDDKLQELILKWRQAAQSAADHMFVSAEQRFQRMGGMAGYRDRQNRGRSSGWGFTDEDPEEGLTEEQKEARRIAMYEAGFDEMSELEKQQNETKEVKDDGDVSTFPFLHIYQSHGERQPLWDPFIHSDSLFGLGH
ncbi:hypothetical protein TWF481_001696 [Arthrobotrys musiformis]|uniref:Uncharacterized protein n=1 Tax=Arthrobotrys musiformis TaxID=47236 RepID=A0AAV9VV43_9PEZI